MRRVLVAALILVVPSLTSCGGSSSSPQEEVSVMQQRDTTVTAVTIKPGNYELTIAQPGTTYAIRDIELESRVTGYIQKVAFQDGTLVEEGDLLFQVDPRPFEASLLQARGNLEAAVADRNLASSTLERNRPLVETGAVSREQFDTLVSNLEQAEGKVEVAAGQLVDAELNLGYTQIRAPFKGRVGQREVELGDLVQASGNPNLVSLVQYDPMRVLVSVPARELEQLVALKAKGEIKARVRVNGTRGGGGKVFDGVVDFIDNTVNQMTSTVMVRVRFDNPDAWAYPGQYSEAEIMVGNVPDAITIPQESLRAQQGGGRYVWLIDDKDKITRQDVTVGTIRTGVARIIKGLRPGQRVVVHGSPELASCDKVTIVTGSSKSGDSKSDDASKSAKPSSPAKQASSSSSGTGG